MEAFGLVRSLAKLLLLPPALLVLVTAAGLLLMRKAPRTGRALAWTGVLALYVLSTPMAAWWLVRALDAPAAFDVRDAADTGAVVILGAGLRRDAREYGGDTLAPLTLERVRYGARVARATGLPVLVSGGGAQDSETEADVMRRVLEDEFGVRVRWAEARSRNTRQNASYSAEILREASIHRVVLVTHAFDMLRARAEFGDRGILTVPAATGLPHASDPTWIDVIPSMNALHLSYYATYELAANLERKLQVGTRPAAP